MSRIHSLFEGEELLRRVLDAVPGGVVHVGLDGSIRGANADAVRVLGLHYDELTTRYVSDWNPQTILEDGSPCPATEYPVAHVLATGKPAGPKTIGIRRPDDSLVWAVFRAVPIRSESGALEGAIVTFLDITERKRAEEKLQRSEVRWRSLAENLPDFVVTADRQMRLLSSNRIVAPLTEKEVIGSRLIDWIDEDFRDAYRSAFESAIETKSPTRTETRSSPRDGAAIWFDVIFVPLVVAGTVDRVLVVARDITDRKTVEDALRASELKWRTLAENLPDYLLTTDASGTILSLNHAAAGVSESDVIGSKLHVWCEPPHREEFLAKFEEAVATRRPTRADSCWWDGTAMNWYDVIFAPLVEGDVLKRLLVVARDITVRRRAEDELRRSEEKWRRFCENTPDFISLVDRDARFIYVNRVVADLDARDVLQKRLYDYVAEESVDVYRASFEEAIATRRAMRFETTGHGLGGAPSWYECVFVPLVSDEKVDHVMVVARDITARKRAEEGLQASVQNWRRLVESLPDAVIVLDRERRIVQVNERTEAAVAGTDRATMVGRLADDFCDETMVEDFRRHFEKALETSSSVRYEIRGARDPVRGTTAWHDTVLVPLAVNGVVERVLLVARDITKQRALVATLAEKERLASVGMVAASVAHEIMNPLTYVLANLDHVLAEKGPGETRETKALREAREGAKRMQQIVFDLRALGRVGGEELLYVDPRSVLETALRLSGPEVGRAAPVKLDLAEVPGVFASESRLCQVFINLLVNAAQAMDQRPPSEREISVRTRHDEAAGLVGVDITDRGVGIPPDHIERIFEPLYTTKRAGTGLGLSISKDIVARMGGRIEVNSTPGRGTTFTVWLSTTRTA